MQTCPRDLGRSLRKPRLAARPFDAWCSDSSFRVSARNRSFQVANSVNRLSAIRNAFACASVSGRSRSRAPRRLGMGAEAQTTRHGIQRRRLGQHRICRSHRARCKSHWVKDGQRQTFEGSGLMVPVPTRHRRRRANPGSKLDLPRSAFPLGHSHRLDAD